MINETRKPIDPNSRDYDFKDIDVDPRFKVCLKEVFICIGIFVAFAAAMLISVFVIGGGNPLEYTYILGMPAWYFCVLLVCAATCALVAVILDKFFTHMSLEAVGELEEKKK